MLGVSIETVYNYLDTALLSCKEEYRGKQRRRWLNEDEVRALVAERGKVTTNE